MAWLVFLALALVILVAMSAWQAYRIEARHQELIQWLDALGEMISDNLDNHNEKG